MKASRVLALLLAFCMVLTACSSSGAETAVAATYDGGELPAGVYLYYLTTAISTVTGSLGIFDESVLEETFEGENAADWIVATARKAMRTHASVESKFNELGLSLSDEVLNYADATLSGFWEKFGYEMNQYGISKSSAETVILNSIKADLLLGTLYSEGGEYEISEEELLDFYKENYRRTILLVMSMANLSQDSFAVKEELFDDYYERAKDGEELFDLIVEEYARTGGLTMEEAYDFFDGNTQEQVISRNTDLPADLVEQIFSTTAIDVPQQYSDDNYNIIFEVRDLVGDGFNFDYMRENLIRSYADEDYRAKLDAWSENIGYAENPAAIDRYQPEHILKTKIM